ncbi:hypothetical protein [Kibdelosporangium phytohabitans]|uniref:Uncharacterized protein n=1 Tax=Kibdelosporangium phytohabitans TaxID=860235 RepID=A0A0N9I6G1_9PSEU|nr:hypothetical protein [Kibdelosporangium phytohabitans]ALG13724.1 hypothetical protein AOZ06_48800 [Kibdelosporangium phytohabitans]MBE1465615.1 hypothetical protein [Kibdelosporangium phytohabitans]
MSGELGPVERFLRREKYFGVPRWVVGGVLVGVIASVALVRGQVTTTDRVRAAVEGFRHSSVYVEPGAPPTVNAEHVRRVLGDRPIVVAILNGEPMPPSGKSLVTAGLKLCDDLASLVPTNLVIVYGNEPGKGYNPAFCVGPRFNNEDHPVNASNFDFVLIAKAESAWKYRESPTDLTPQVEEYVLAYDAQAAKDYPDSVPRRGAVPDKLATGEIVLSLGGIVAACVALFFLLHLAARAVGRRGPRSRERLETEARLSRIGEYVLSADPQDANQAEVARQYVLALQGHESGANVRRQVDELERLVR